MLLPLTEAEQAEKPMDLSIDDDLVNVRKLLQPEANRVDLKTCQFIQKMLSQHFGFEVLEMPEQH